ncbi:MAG: hypothetical protein CM15mP74_07660 [Halieaceae bacterium]|nr:MAG: hypothetical protein CM15mP74_07660 [Halieaceae bacterium]
MAVVPSLAIHLDREANKQRSINPQKDVVPLVMLGDAKGFDFKSWLAEKLAEQDKTCVGARVMDYELSLYDTQPPALVGIDQSFVTSARLDNLLSCYAGLRAIIDEQEAEWSMLVATDHEEVGSASAIGAQGPMLMDALTRWCLIRCSISSSEMNPGCSRSIMPMRCTRTMRISMMSITAPNWERAR